MFNAKNEFCYHSNYDGKKMKTLCNGCNFLKFENCTFWVKEGHGLYDDLLDDLDVNKATMISIKHVLDTLCYTCGEQYYNTQTEDGKRRIEKEK